MEESRKELFKNCEHKLMKARQDLMNGFQHLGGALSEQVVGDEADMAQTLENQHTSLLQREKLLRQIKEIDEALKRLQAGNYGICEETEEPIEEDRLLALPWTRLSLEGAEIRERRARKFA